MYVSMVIKLVPVNSSSLSVPSISSFCLLEVYAQQLFKLYISIQSSQYKCSAAKWRCPSLQVVIIPKQKSNFTYTLCRSALLLEDSVLKNRLDRLPKPWHPPNETRRPPLALNCPKRTKSDTHRVHQKRMTTFLGSGESLRHQV